MQLEEEDPPVFSLSTAKADAREATDSNSEISSEPLEPGEETQSQVHVFRIPLARQPERPRSTCRLQRDLVGHVNRTVAEVGVGSGVLDDRGDALHGLPAEVGLEPRGAE